VKTVYRELSLNGTWNLRDEILSYPVAEGWALAGRDDGWVAQPVPGDIHQGLELAGRIKPPLLGLNSFDCVWTEQRSWWFRRRFEVAPEMLGADVVELELQGLDANAEIYLNGAHIGSHANAFRPFVQDVRTRLLPGANVLLVRLTAGVETVSELDVDHCDGVRASTEAGNGRPERGDPRRTFARKPQYAWGWDWSPRVATTAIGGDVTLRALWTACIRDVALAPLQLGEAVAVDVTVTVDQFHYTRTREGWIRLTLTDPEGRVIREERKVLLRSGLTHIDVRLPLAAPHYWWPNGVGPQDLYRVEAELAVDGETVAYPAFDWGLRFVALDTEDTFAFVINGQRVFAKGANWIPADTLYACVTPERYDALVREARDANFTMLRVWGGGLYERSAFYEACDRYGIMVWHDFMYSCAPYPDDLAAFALEAEREADYQTRRLRRHASVVLWCGNNENTWGFVDWWHGATRGGAQLYNYVLPEIVHRNCPGVPYWNSSPYGGETPNAPDVGDRHHWGDCTMNPDMDKRITPEEYDKTDARFISEFGYIGAPVKETVSFYLDGAPFDRQGAVWQHHTNTFEKNTVDAGIRKHYVDPDALSPDEYLLYSGLVQGTMYGYALDSMRARANCYGSLFWMFADCWGEVGWTIVDAYLRRKPSWYFVRRTYAPIRLIARPGSAEPGGPATVQVIAVNDTRREAAFEVAYGWVSLDGEDQALQRTAVTVPALARQSVVSFSRENHNPREGLWVARVVDPQPASHAIPPAIFRACDYRELATVPARLEVTVVAAHERACILRIASAVYAHAVHFVLPEGALPSDAYFDLLPGDCREVAITADAMLSPADIAVRCVNAA